MRLTSLVERANSTYITPTIFHQIYSVRYIIKYIYHECHCRDLFLEIFYIFSVILISEIFIFGLIRLNQIRRDSNSIASTDLLSIALNLPFQNLQTVCQFIANSRRNRQRLLQNDAKTWMNLNNKFRRIFSLNVIYFQINYQPI